MIRNNAPDTGVAWAACGSLDCSRCDADFYLWESSIQQAHLKTSSTLPALWQTTTVPDWSKRSLTGRSVLERLTAPAQQGTGGCQEVDTLQVACGKVQGMSPGA